MHVVAVLVAAVTRSGAPALHLSTIPLQGRHLRRDWITLQECCRCMHVRHAMCKEGDGRTEFMSMLWSRVGGRPIPRGVDALSGRPLGMLGSCGAADGDACGASTSSHLLPASPACSTMFRTIEPTSASKL